LSYDWSDEELNILKSGWLRGLNDHQLIDLLPKRTGKSIAAKRRALHLTMRFHPNRTTAKFPHHGRVYTSDDDHDILDRYNNGESLLTIAQSYGVSERAIECKIERLLEREPLKPHLEMTDRKCLGCGKLFASREPKSINRRCPTCTVSMQEGGSSYMMVY